MTVNEAYITEDLSSLCEHLRESVKKIALSDSLCELHDYLKDSQDKINALKEKYGIQ